MSEPIKLVGVIVTLQIEGFHNWPNAPKKVHYLRDLHRHIFHITCKKIVFHNDREIEIITLKNTIKAYFNDMYSDGIFDKRSCESIANELLEQFNLYYCSVLEDNENGAEVFITV